jgi:hypothetical protein
LRPALVVVDRDDALFLRGDLGAADGIGRCRRANAFVGAANRYPSPNGDGASTATCR